VTRQHTRTGRVAKAAAAPGLLSAPKSQAALVETRTTDEQETRKLAAGATPGQPALFRGPTAGQWKRPAGEQESDVEETQAKRVRRGEMPLWAWEMEERIMSAIAQLRQEERESR
jgi:hypothetical protein